MRTALQFQASSRVRRVQNAAENRATRPATAPSASADSLPAMLLASNILTDVAWITAAFGRRCHWPSPAPCLNEE
jgi:hypothetical protein